MRFAPDEIGKWQVNLFLVNANSDVIQTATGSFVCGPADGDTPFELHGPIRLAPNKRHLEHVDGTPFSWLADTAWNGPLRATDEEWKRYLGERQRQHFTAVQWVATHWRTAPAGDRLGQLAFTGVEQIRVNPAFFQRLDQQVKATARRAAQCARFALGRWGWTEPRG